MPPLAREENSGRPMRMPQQHVRPGRGTAGYMGNVEVYETEPPASYTSDGGIDALAAADEAALVRDSANAQPGKKK